MPPPQKFFLIFELKKVSFGDVLVSSEIQMQLQFSKMFPNKI